MKTTTMILSLVATMFLATTSFAGSESLSASCNKVSSGLSGTKTKQARQVASKKSKVKKIVTRR